MASLEIQYSAEYGFTRDHWATIQAWARDNRRHMVIFRTGKEKAIPWIELGFPAKPLSQKAKVDPDVGLLIAKEADQEQAAYDAGFHILKGSNGSLGPFHPHQPPGRMDTSKGSSWVLPNVVIDPKLGLPLTSDYDLAAVIDCLCPDYYLTYASVVQQTTRGSTNLWVDAVADQLNELFESERIMHGSQAQYTGDLINLGWNQEEFNRAVREGKSEKLLAFYPDGAVRAFSASAANSYLILQEILTTLHPALQHSFYH